MRRFDAIFIGAGQVGPSSWPNAARRLRLSNEIPQRSASFGATKRRPMGYGGFIDQVEEI
jgi:hypothetical protein